tara:strand:- start:2874 stop:3011 length:138 start_codon:yes stop_codon:yes gene_type:complete
LHLAGCGLKHKNRAIAAHETMSLETGYGDETKGDFDLAIIAAAAG